MTNPKADLIFKGQPKIDRGQQQDIGSMDLETMGLADHAMLALASLRLAKVCGNNAQQVKAYLAQAKAHYVLGQCRVFGAINNTEIASMAIDNRARKMLLEKGIPVHDWCKYETKGNDVFEPLAEEFSQLVAYSGKLGILQRCEDDLLSNGVSEENIYNIIGLMRGVSRCWAQETSELESGQMSASQPDVASDSNWWHKAEPRDAMMFALGAAKFALTTTSHDLEGAVRYTEMSGYALKNILPVAVENKLGQAKSFVDMIDIEDPDDEWTNKVKQEVRDYSPLQLVTLMDVNLDAARTVSSPESRDKALKTASVSANMLMDLISQHHQHVVLSLAAVKEAHARMTVSRLGGSLPARLMN